MFFDNFKMLRRKKLIYSDKDLDKLLENWDHWSGSEDGQDNSSEDDSADEFYEKNAETPTYVIGNDELDSLLKNNGLYSSYTFSCVLRSEK